MTHVRLQIRDAAATALGAIADVTVMKSRVLPVDQADIPALLVYANDEEIVGGTMGAYQRTLDLVIEAVAKGGAVDDDLGGLIVSVEQTLNGSKLGGICKPLAPTAISMDVDASSNTNIGRARITYRAIYYTEHSTPETAV